MVTFLRVSVHSPPLRIGNVAYNVDHIIQHISTAHQKKSMIAVFPELCLSGYTCGDLFYQTALIEECYKGLSRILEVSKKKQITCIVGMPLAHENRLYNVACIINQGNLVGIVPKTYLPCTDEYYEMRWFCSGRMTQKQSIEFNGQSVPFGTNLLFSSLHTSNCTLGVEICGDLWAPIPPSSEMSIAGANIICNLSASNELIYKAQYRKNMLQQQSQKCAVAYLYSSAGPNESTTDMVFSGHCLIAENGHILQENQRFCFEGTYIITDLDIELLNNTRIKNHHLGNTQSHKQYTRLNINISLGDEKQFQKKLYRTVNKNPFFMVTQNNVNNLYIDIMHIQTTALIKRMHIIQSQKNVIGISGGLDSTLALLVIVKSYQKLGWSLDNIIAISMPGLGTTQQTQSNAKQLATLLKTSFREIPIIDAIHQHFQDIQHDIHQYDTIFENAQARERTQILMDVANQVGGMVIGTSDLSEIALGWSTYNGDSMAMYHINAGLPKTMVQKVVEWYANEQYSGRIQKILHMILDTPFSPELLPSTNGVIQQKTEDIIGKYELNDFFLYYVVEHGFTPEKIIFLAEKAFDNHYTRKELCAWLKLFYKRFMTNQFKRSAMPDSPKITVVGLSPRTDWRMPSDADPTTWLERLDIKEKK